MLRFRTLEKIGCPRSQRNQAFQRVAVVTVTLLVLLDARNYRDPPLLSSRALSYSFCVIHQLAGDGHEHFVAHHLLGGIRHAPASNCIRWTRRARPWTVARGILVDVQSQRALPLSQPT